MSTLLALTDALVIPDTVDGTALLISMTASHHLAKTVSKDFIDKLVGRLRTCHSWFGVTSSKLIFLA